MLTLQRVTTRWTRRWVVRLGAWAGAATALPACTVGPREEPAAGAPGLRSGVTVTFQSDLRPVWTGERPPREAAEATVRAVDVLLR